MAGAVKRHAPSRKLGSYAGHVYHPLRHGLSLHIVQTLSWIVSQVAPILTRIHRIYRLSLPSTLFMDKALAIIRATCSG